MFQWKTHLYPPPLHLKRVLFKNATGCQRGLHPSVIISTWKLIKWHFKTHNFPLFTFYEQLCAHKHTSTWKLFFSNHFKSQTSLNWSCWEAQRGVAIQSQREWVSLFCLRNTELFANKRSGTWVAEKTFFTRSIKISSWDLSKFEHLSNARTHMGLFPWEQT